MKTVTFQNTDQKKGVTYQFTVKDDYFKDQSLDNVTTMSLFDLMTKTDIIKYLHCEIGPSLLNVTTGDKQYWLDGKIADQEVQAKIEHRMKFNNEFKQVLEENVD